MSATTNSSTYESILALAAGNRLNAIQAVLQWQIEAWKLALEPSQREHGGASAGTGKGRIVSREKMAHAVNKIELGAIKPDSMAACSEKLFRHLESHQLCWKTKYGETVISAKALEPVRLVRSLCDQFMSDEDIRYFVFASIRRGYRCVLSSETARFFHSMADGVNRKLIDTTGTGKRNKRVSWGYRKFLRDMRRMAAQLGGDLNRQKEFLQAFLGVVVAVNYVQLDHKPGSVVCLTREMDGEFLLSSLFGLPTRMRGFDQLFGNGLLLVEDPPFDGSDHLGERIRGRVVLASGRYGSGKSLLALQIAVEVARKGGVALVLALEQPPEECLYTLRAMCLLPNDGSIEIATTTIAAARIFRDRADLRMPSRGSIVLIKTDKSAYEEFLGVLPEISKWMNEYAFRLIVVDPINAIQRDSEATTTELRNRTLSTFENLKYAGTNIWFNAEEDPTPDSSFFEKNIADTVINLSASDQHGNVQRYMEIQKSRLQREQRGRHPFEIITGQGIHVYPSSAAVSKRIHSRTPRMPQGKSKFGLSTLDEILGTGAISTGDVIVLQGPKGCFKTVLGLHFVHHLDPPDRIPSKQWVTNAMGRNLVFATGDAELGLRWMTDQLFGTNSTVDTVCLPDGHVHPGQILQDVEAAIALARYQDYAVDRVMIDNVSHWQTSCPFLRDDEIFGNTLIELLRRQDVTTILVCGTASPDTSRLQASIVDNADCVIEFDAVPFQGKSQVMLRVIKSRGMGHRREWFELYGEASSVVVRPTPSLLRVSADGTVSRSPIRLFLHDETDMQAQYHLALKKRIERVVSRDVDIDPMASYDANWLSLSKYSVLDELQIVEVDEHQVPNALSKDGSLKVIPFDRREGLIEWDQLLTRLANRVESPQGGRVAVPYYENISLMAVNGNIDNCNFGGCDLRSWRSIAVSAQEYEAQHLEGIFFDFEKSTDENYNCLFLEILLSLKQTPSGREDADFPAWLAMPEASEALVLFWSLCHRPHLAKKQKGQERLQVDPDARIWRHWYSTLNQMLSQIHPAKRTEIRVVPLPGRVSVAGEWFLAIPIHSAAPQLAMQLVAMMTSREAESDRLRRGVGLPTREHFYSGQESEMQISTPVSPFFSMQVEALHHLVKNAFCRSHIKQYSRLSPDLTSYLQRTLELPQCNQSDAAQILRSLKTRIETALFSHPQNLASH